MNPFRNMFLSLSRMPPFLMLLIICGLAVTATALYMQQADKAKNEVAQIKAASEAEKNVKDYVVMTKKDITEGELFSDQNVELKEVQKAQVPQQAVQSTSGLYGNAANCAIASGNIVFQSFVKPIQAQVTDFEGKIGQGMRAVTFGIDTNSGVAGFVAPDSLVDILCITGAGAEVKAAPVLSTVKVIAVGTTYRKAPGETQATAASSVTVVVNPDDAEKLVKSVTAGRPYLVLRNSKDLTPVPTVDIAALFPKPKEIEVPTETASNSLPPPSLPPPPLPGGTGSVGSPDAAPPGPPPPPPMHEIELWSGSKKEVLSVPQG